MADEELKNLLRRNLEVAEDTNHVVRAMNRRAYWGGVLKFLWWFVILILIPAVTYYVYLQPRLDQLQGAYQNFQSGTQEMQSIKASLGNNAFTEFLKKFGSSSSTTSAGR